MLDLLSQEELATLTGSKQSKRQAAILDDHGICYVTRLDGTIITTAHHVNNPAKHQLSSNNDSPDFSKVITGNECHGNVPLMDFLEANFHQYVMTEDQILMGAELFSYPDCAIPATSGCYFLLLGSEVVYVGKATNLSKRINDHFIKSEKAFTHISYIGTPCAHVAEYVEGFYMQLLKPCHNKYRPATCDISDKILERLCQN